MKPSFLVVILAIFLLHTFMQPCSAQEGFSGFNYPIGSRNPGFVTEVSDTDGWFNYNFKTHDDDPRTDGFHSGEDWNDDCAGTTDVGAQVYAVADGEVIGPRDYIGASGKSLGDVLIIKYPVSQDESVYSLYLHIDSSVNEGNSVKRDQQIGTIADISPAGLPPHLHFELRAKPIDINNLWPSDDDTRPNNAYYNDSKNDTGEVIETYSQKMDKDGLIDPSNFIDSHRPLSTSLQRGKIPSDFQFDHDLASGMCRYEIRYLQNLLNRDPDTRVATEGDGSIGNEVSTFGTLTKDAVIKFQEKYVEGESTGEVNSATREKMNRFLNAALELKQSKPFIDKGVCPGEGCSYGTWRVRKTTPLRTQPDDGAPVIGTVPAGVEVQALTGEVHVAPLQFVVSKSHGPYKKGDVLWVLTYLGEGYFKFRFGEKIFEEDLGFSPYGGSYGDRCQEPVECWGELNGTYQARWWVQIKTTMGLIGWADSENFIAKIMH